ncbi:hypothetical protein K438DRAFT_1996575 [Mycena galopus ATCC 62051]|nr:hypothetical protein K438DRAFT_1996575 [Mycena galopus ATCC 62051]
MVLLADGLTLTTPLSSTSSRPHVSMKCKAQGASEDFTETIICTNYDLEDALWRENQARIACEDCGFLDDDDDDPDVEEAPHDVVPLPCNPGASTYSPVVPPGLTDGSPALASPTPPLPSPHVLEKAACCSPVQTAFAAEDLHTTKQRWTVISCEFANT